MSDLENDLRGQLAGEADRVQSMPRELWLRIVDGAGGVSQRWLRITSGVVAVLFVVGAVALLSRAQHPTPAGSAVAGRAATPGPQAQSASPHPGASATPGGSFACGAAPSGGVNGLSANLTAVRVAHQPGFDRVTFEFSGAGLPEYSIGQQAGTHFNQDASGKPVDLLGVQGLKIVFRDASGQGTYTASTDIKLDPAAPGANAVDAPSIAEVRQVGDFERVLGWAVGLNTKPGCLHVSELGAPARLVVDVQDRPKG